MEGKLFTRKQIAELLSVKSCTIKKWEAEGKIKPKFHLNGRPRYLVAEVFKALKIENNNQ